MGDKNTIPRTFSGLLGVADVENSVKRHYMPIPLIAPQHNTTTGLMFGADSNTTGIPFFQRNVTFERLYVSGFKQTTVNNSTTLMRVQMFKDGDSTVFDLLVTQNTTTQEEWKAESTTPDIANLDCDDRISVKIPVRNEMTQLSVVACFRERIDD